ncbi:hypothetical protein NMY22_g13035 [Coprinellus aureogranulatus]|nr:hypothetical protein NMY22_g13035 [Coprinellus aureogranulatus]
MCPEDEESMALAQPIIDVAHETLEEIHLKHSYITLESDLEDEQSGYLLLAGLLNLKNLHQLRVFELRSGIHDSDPDRENVVKDITKVLSTIPKANSLSRIYIRVQVFGEPPYNAAKSQKWNALAKEVARISPGKPLRFELDMDIQSEEGDPLDDENSPDENQMKELYDHIEKEMKALRTVEGVEVEFKNELTDMGPEVEDDDDFVDDIDSDSDIY